MIAKVRSVDFLPEIFQTPVNKQFLSATLDQLIQEPAFKATQGYIGQKVGPGVNPNDYYVVEPTKTRNDYQLEPGVISLDPTTGDISDAITYPGMLDALALQGAVTDNNSRLFESDYYAWDPFVDFDKFSNYSQYYWLPNGPIPVYVSASNIPPEETFVVTKANGYYTFSGVAGNNPSLTLARNGSYQFQVAQNSTASVEYRVTNNKASSWLIDYEANPTLTLTRGNTYTFNLVQDAPYKFYIKTAQTYGTTNLYSNGVINNGATQGLVTFTVPQDAPNTLYYVNDAEFNLRGTFNIIDGTPGTGSKFWIQTQPGISGTLPWSPNISNRTVLGVTNNGIDLGTVLFDVPAADAQSFYTSMPPINYPTAGIGKVDLIVENLKFNQINNVLVSEFLAANPSGIDGVTSLDQKTIVFLNQVTDPYDGGWTIDTPFDPVDRTEVISSNFVTGYPYVISSLGTTNWNTVAGTSGVVYQNGDLILATGPVTGTGRGIAQQVALTTGPAGFDISGIGYPTQPFDSGPPGYSVVPYDTITPQIITGTPDINDGLPGTFDTWTFDQSNPINPASYYSVWQIRYTVINNATYMQLTSVASVNKLSQFSISAGDVFVNTNWYKNSNGFFQQMPLLTASLDTLYYQDSTDPTIFGALNLITEDTSATINVDVDILGKKTYTSPNGVTFTNGLQIIFSGNVTPTSYETGAYYVEGVGTGIKLLPVVDFVTPETYTPTVSVPYDRYPYDSGVYNPSTNQALAPDYMTINRASPDLNPWTRSNRWFHVDTITQAAAYNNTSPLFINAQRASRPILEFRAGTRLFNFGTDGIPAVNIIDFSQTDALSNVNGQEGYGYDGYNFSQGSLVIFAADTDADVRNQIYQVNFIVPDPETSTVPIIDLVPMSYGPALFDQTTVCLSGLTQTGLSYTYNGTTWVASQQKTSVNQPPLFDVYDASGYSFGNQTKYPSTNFTGCKLLSYAENPDNPVDSVLGIPLAFFYLDNIGDIEFTNNLYTDSFIYTPVNAGVTVQVSSGFVREYTDRLTFTREIGWQTASAPSQQRQQFQFAYDGLPLQLDILVGTDTDVPAVQIFINNVFQPPSTYTVGVNEKYNTTLIRLTGTGYVTGDIIEVLVLSDQVSKQAFYEVPANLENNPFNGNSPYFTLGTVRSHYATICENLLTFRGTINGRNNTRDLGNIVPYGQQILQQSSPLTLGGYFLRSNTYNIFASIEYNSREYTKYKDKLLNEVTQLNIGVGQSVSSILDQAILNITKNLTGSAPFYWSDMLPSGTNYTSNSTTVTPITTRTFNTIQTYDFTKSNYLGLLVYYNGELLIRGRDYVVSPDAPKFTLTFAPEVGAVVMINEYPNTAGSYVPNTPSKMGLYPKYMPEIFVDTTYIHPTPVIQGHDGSITIAFGDIRDQVLLEFEKRIYDNIKVDDNPIPLTTEGIEPNFFPAQTTALLPGYFRKTPYTYEETNTILSESFLSWVGQNKVDYTTQNYVANNPWTYNYSQSANRIDGDKLLQGNWRGIYRYFYDTETPDTTPWEMLGFSEMPAYWEQRYGPAPYTSGNGVLWEDLEAGLVADPLAPYVLLEYARPGLSKVIPVDSEGVLLEPLECVVGLNDPYSFKQSWKAGDGGPTQAAWWNSSSYPFAIMRLLALTKPAQFFSVYADRDLYRYDTVLGQYLYNGRYRLDAAGIQIYGNGVSKASYINWIVDYNRQLGINSTTALTTALSNLDVRLCYRMAAFTDAQYLTLYTERAGPGSTNNSLAIPPNSYNLLFYKNQPFKQITYSSIIIEQTQLGTGGVGFTVFGYSNLQPYFKTLVSSPVGLYQTLTVADVTVQVPSQYTTDIANIPYGYTFTNPASVCDFILGYGAYLESQGLVFDNIENGYTLDWKQMATEFLYFAAQGWTPGTLINLNPVATTIKATQPISIVDTIASTTPENMLLDQYQHVIDVRNMVVNRDGNTFSVTSTAGQTISFLTLRFTNYEDMVVLNNTTQYNDLIYDPTSAARQIRLNMKAFTTTDWDGQLNAQGFVLNLNNVKQWQPFTKYTKGEIVLHKNSYWQALDIIQPEETFNFNYWVNSNYQLIDQGLLPNLANKANQLANTYDIYNANLMSDNDLFAFGLIGFRPRQYMSNMNLDGITQVQLYQQFLGTKGTRQAAQLFSKANLGKESGDYKIYENWAILAGTYGAQANKSFFEIALNEALLQYNPSTVQIINPGTASQADQTVLLSDLWKESYKITSPDILPTTYEGSGTSTGLPTAGYVSLDDVDITVFNINDPTSLDTNIDLIGIGTYVWVAKTNSYNWGVFRAALVPPQLTQLSNNLSNTSLAQFNGVHGLSAGDLIIVKYFNSSVNGVYRVLSVPSVTTIIIEYAFNSTTGQTSVTGTGLVFHLQNARVSQASDITTLPYVNNLLPGARVWIDNNGAGKWEVVEKQEPFASTSTIAVNALASAKYGASVAQTVNNTAALVGAPGTESGAGAVYTYVRSQLNEYNLSTGLTLDATDAAGFGNIVTIGSTNWGVAGASASLSNTGYAAVLSRNVRTGQFSISQLLVPPDLNFDPVEFGAAATISADEQWMYIGAPANNTVYAYERVDIEQQSVNYVADGYQTTFNYADYIQIDWTKPYQLYVTVGSTEVLLGTNYTVTDTSIVFTSPLVAGQQLAITRKQESQLDFKTYYRIAQNSTSGSGTGARFTVSNTRGTYYTTLATGGLSYAVGNTLTINYNQISNNGTGSSANNLVITVTAVNGSGTITAFTTTGSGVGNTSTFTLSDTLYTATNIYSFTVVVDGQIQRPYLDYTFNTGTTVLTFNSGSIPAAGAEIIVTSDTYWQYVDAITSTETTTGDNFGSSLATTTDGRQVIIGAPGTEVSTFAQAGQVYVYDRSVFKYQVTDVDTTTYSIPTPFTGPVGVSVNGQYLLTTTESLTGQYTVSGNNVVFSNITFTIGDEIEIDTNQFQPIQQLDSHTVNLLANYGSAVESCPLNCSIYVGAPSDSTYLAQAGSVDHLVNQSRVYGVISSTIANPFLTIGGTIRVNDYEVTVPTNGAITVLIDAINSANIPNVVATPTPDAVFTGDGTTQAFDIGTLYSAADSYTTVVYVNGVLQTEGVQYTYNSSTEQILFVTAPDAGTTILVVSGRMVLSIQNMEAADAGNMLTVLPGTTGTTYYQVGFDTFVFTQQILSPAPTVSAYFGSSLSIDTSATNLIVGAPNGNVYEPTTFDGGATYFDEHSTVFYNQVSNSGVAYTYDYFPSSTSSINNPGQFAFGQQIYSDLVEQGDNFGTAVNYTSGKLMVGATGGIVNGTQTTGYVSLFNNPTLTPAWKPIRVQQPVVDVYQLNGVFSYNKLLNSTQTYFDFFDPLQGKILGVARRNIDYIGAVDPASYNTGTIHNNGNSWGPLHVGEMWWDTDTVRFIDPNQDDIVYASRKWGSTFPGSRVDVYQWIESTVPPASYTGSGTPLSTTSYTVSSKLGTNNLFQTLYYFWVRGITTIADGAGKTLSAQGVANYITDPRSSGLPYIAALNASTIAIYNARNLISAQTTILSIGFDRQLTDDNIHQEYELIADGVSDAFLNANLYRKLQDSLCGIDTAGNLVPDPKLSPGEQIGVQFRPRQSMFVNRFTALQNYLGRANTVMAQYPIAETRSFALLNAVQPTPQAGTGAWNFEVANLEELSYQNLSAVPVGYKYLVLSDSSQQGYWTIYQVVSGPALSLLQVQSYNTPNYWYYINWYLPGYNSTIAPQAAVPNYAGLSTLSYELVPIGASARVVNNGANKWEIYLRTGTDAALDWQRVGLEDGTIQFKEELWNYPVGGFGFDTEVFDAQYFDQEPVIETRYIVQALNEQIYINDLQLERNSSLMLMFNFIYTESTNPSWLIKTSLVDVDHKIRNLEPYQTYLQDNQNFVLDYFTEVKPYHVQVRQFNLIYSGQDDFLGDLTDYDVPAYYDYALTSPQYVSPILTPYDTAITPNYSTVSDAAADAQIWLTSPWAQWYENYLLEITAVIVADGGANYTVPPVVYLNGELAVGWSTIINSAGKVVAINPVLTGQRYTATPVIELVGGGSSEVVPARAYAQMGNNLVRSIKTTIKYDRYQYTTTIVDWTANTTYTAGTQVRYDNVVWEAIETVTNSVFDPAQWDLTSAGTLSGVDRTAGYYVADVNQPGLDLPLLIDGIAYPGVQVKGLSYDYDTGFDLGAFDITPFDNYFVGPTGQPTYDPALLDAIYASEYRDTYLGTRPSDINVSGWKYISEYASHAPEELVPGAVFDTLDMRVYTTPGGDWEGDGHGFPEAVTTYIYTGAAIALGSPLPYPYAIVIVNQTTQSVLNEGSDYSIDWTTHTFTVLNNSALNLTATGDVLAVYTYELGGGNQLYKNTYTGADINSDNELTIPVQNTLISELVIFINGVQLPSTEYSAPIGPDQIPVTRTTTITFDSSYASDDFIVLTAIGPTDVNGTTINYSWSTPVTEYFTADGSTTEFDLTNSLAYTNAVNAIVEVNGQRIRTAAGIEYIGNGIETLYTVPSRLAAPTSSEDALQSSMTAADLIVYIDSVEVESGDYVLQPYAGSGTARTIRFASAPPAASQIYIATTIAAAATIDTVANTVTLATPPISGSVVAVTTWNDLRQQRMATLVFVGPVEENYGVVAEGYDTTDFDLALVTNTPGSFDYSTGVSVVENELHLRRVITDSSRLWVTLNGARLAPNVDFTLSNVIDPDDPANSGTQIILAGGYVLQVTDVLMVTMVTDSVVPEAMAFRIFQDMRGVQATYRITPSTTTVLTQDLSAAADTIYVASTDGLTVPDFAANVWGVITIDGERIMYRDISINSTTTITTTAQTANLSTFSTSVTYNSITASELTVEVNSVLVPTSEYSIVNVNNLLSVTFDTPLDIGDTVMLTNTSTNRIGGLLRGTAGTAAANHAAGANVYNMGRDNLLEPQYQNYIVSTTVLANGTQTVFVASNIIL